MGQYHTICNLTKRQFIRPHGIGSGMKLSEQMGWVGSPADCLFLLLACSNGRGGGDAKPHPLIGSWAGDNIAVVGDYAEGGDLKNHDAVAIAGAVFSDTDLMTKMADEGSWVDISAEIREMMTSCCGLSYQKPEWMSESGNPTRAYWQVSI